jgi:hypothetical protein
MALDALALFPQAIPWTQSSPTVSVIDWSRVMFHDHSPAQASAGAVGGGAAT